MFASLIFKIIGFSKRNNQDWDCIAILENGKEISVDPYVGCAFDYEKREHLLGQWWKAEGHYFEDGTFLPAEGKFNIYLK